MRKSILNAGNLVARVSGLLFGAVARGKIKRTDLELSLVLVCEAQDLIEEVLAQYPTSGEDLG